MTNDPAPLSTGSPFGSVVRNLLSNLGPLLALGCVILFFSLADHWFADGTFATQRNLRTVTVQTTVVAIAALGMTVIIISGGIDLSAGTTLALCATTLAWGLREDIAFRWRYGDNVVGAAEKLKVAHTRLESAIRQKRNDDEIESLRVVVEKHRAITQQLLDHKIDFMASRLPETNSDSADKLDGPRGRLVELIDLRLNGTEPWLTKDESNSPVAQRHKTMLENLRARGGLEKARHDWRTWIPNSPWSASVAVAISLFTGVVVGLVNGFLVSVLRVVPFIVTLGTMTIILGCGNLLSQNTPIRASNEQNPSWITNLTNNTSETLHLGFPLGVWLGVALAVLLAGVLRFSVFGRYVFAIGSNEATARLCGINVAWNKVAIYGLAGFFFSVAGLCQFSRVSEGNPMSGIGLELEVIAAVVIGGGSLSGGRGTVLGTLAGALTMAVIKSGGNQLGLADPLQRIILGAIIIGAVTIDQWRQGKFSHG